MIEFSINCNSCGAPNKVILDKNVVCSFCGTILELDNEILFDKIRYKGKSENESQFKILLTNATIELNLGNYKGARSYIKQSLVLDSLNFNLWEIYCNILPFSLEKIISFKDFSELQFVFKNLNGIKNYSDKVDSLKRELLNETYNKFQSYYQNLSYDKSESGKVWDSFSEDSILFLISFIKLSKLHYDTFQNPKILEISILELSGQSKNYWVKNVDGVIVNEEFPSNFNPLETREELINLMKKHHPEFDGPNFVFKKDPLSSNNNGNCYIATSCYGYYNHEDVIILRRFRDDFLRKSRIGSWFISLYYHTSPSLIVFFGSNSLLGNFFRKYFLEPVVILIKRQYYSE